MCDVAIGMSIKKRNFMAIERGDNSSLRALLIEEGCPSKQQGVVRDDHIRTPLQSFLDHCLRGIERKKNSINLNLWRSGN